MEPGSGAGVAGGEAAVGHGAPLGAGSLPKQPEKPPNKFSKYSPARVWLEVYQGL